MHSNRRGASLTGAKVGLGLCLALALPACDTDTAQLIEEINAAREGCTEEELKAADSVCVAMFDRYAEMGEDAIETYIGGMRALDEALRRRGGIQFDTAGLGRPFSDSVFEEPEAEPETPGLLEPARFGTREPYDSEPDARLDSQGGWDTAADRDARLAPEALSGRPHPRDEQVVPTRRAAPAERSSTANRRPRGVLLPPDERLRRPWIGDEPPPEPYLGDSDRRPAPPADREAPAEDGFFRRPEEPIPPYPRE